MSPPLFPALYTEMLKHPESFARDELPSCLPPMCWRVRDWPRVAAQLFDSNLLRTLRPGEEWTFAGEVVRGFSIYFMQVIVLIMFVHYLKEFPI